MVAGFGNGDPGYRASLQAVRAMLDRSGGAAGVTAAELRERRVDVLTVVARHRALMGGYSPRLAVAGGATLSPDMEALIERLDREMAIAIASEPTAVVETRNEIVAA